MSVRLADAFIDIRARITGGSITPEGIAAQVAEFTPAKQLAKIYGNHRELQNRRFLSQSPTLAA